MEWAGDRLGQDHLLHFMSPRFLPPRFPAGDQSVLSRFRFSFAKRVSATKIAIHTRTRSRSRSPIRCIRLAEPFLRSKCTSTSRTRDDRARDDEKEGRAEPLCKNRTRIQRMAREEGRRGGVLSAGRRFANGRPLAEEGRTARRRRQRRRRRGGCAKGARSRADGRTDRP